MNRIAGSLAAAGYDVLLVGRKRKGSIPLRTTSFRQHRLWQPFEKGFLFYAFYNLRLFWYLLWQKADIFCAIDLDTILPVYLASVLRNKKRVYDAHELFTEQKEVLSRKQVHRFWLAVERFAVPRFQLGYTVNHFLQEEFQKRYGVRYEVIRNLPKKIITPPKKNSGKHILYQGSVNEGRCFETLVPAMKDVDTELVICGEGNFFEQTRALIDRYQLGHKIHLKGYLPPEELSQVTPDAAIGLTLFEREGMNQYYSLANRFFDYIMAGIPQVCVNYPAYAQLNKEYGVALLIDDTSSAGIAAALNKLRTDTVLCEELANNCLKAREVLNWEEESGKLLAFYQKIP